MAGSREAGNWAAAGGVDGNHLADVQGAAISSPWDFPPNVLVIFWKFLGKGNLRAEACSGDNIGGVNSIL